jgi:iron complex outermembrane receptor protein
MTRDIRRVFLPWTAGPLTVATALLTTTVSLAQTAPPQSTDTLTTVVVTGSHIVRTDSETPSPVQVITSVDLQESGFTNTQEVLKNLAANGQGTLSQSFNGAFASGAAGIALRGLNVGYTLVLIDGHRTAPYPIGDDGQRSFVDVANIPFDSIERIEVLKDSGSSTYGSDAIAGVINIILKKTYEGDADRRWRHLQPCRWHDRACCRYLRHGEPGQRWTQLLRVRRIPSPGADTIHRPRRHFHTA